jgi:hypothetical protein
MTRETMLEHLRALGKRGEPIEINLRVRAMVIGTEGARPQRYGGNGSVRLAFEARDYEYDSLAKTRWVWVDLDEIIEVQP